MAGRGSALVSGRAQRWTLRGVVGRQERTFLLGSGINRVGSRPERGVVLAHRGVSKRHALILVEEERVTVEDLASKNGTFVNDQRVDSASLAAGDQLRFGCVELTLEPLSPDALAVEFCADTDATEDLGRGSSGMETPYLREAEPGASAALEVGWLLALDAMTRRLPQAPGGSLAPAVDALAVALGRAGAALLEVPPAASPILLATAGQPPGDLSRVLRNGGSLGDGLEGRRIQMRSGGVSLVGALEAGSSTGDSGRLAVVAWGGGDASSSPPLAWWDLVLVWLRRGLQCSEARTGSSHSRSSASERPRLVVPEGYLRGSSPSAERLFLELAAVAPSDLPILVVGETGVGKEGVARTVHLSSRRGQGAFVALNCAAVPSELLEAELFGIGKAVATGVSERRGRFQQAEGGTLFLDEVGEISPGLQAKLLRALQEREVTPVGGRPVTVDVRVVAATNIRLGERLEEGSFRRDLYYRLAGCVLRVPPLKERREDIPALVEHFLRRAVEESGQRVRGLTQDALERLVEHSWPGNVRQLQHVVRRLVLQAAHAQVLDAGLVRAAVADDPMDELAEGETSGRTKVRDGASAELDLESLERRAIVRALGRFDGNQTRAAELLGISRTALYRRLAKHGLDSDLAEVQ